MNATCPECGAELVVSAEPGTIIACPSCGTRLEVLADGDAGYWPLFSMWLLGIITGVAGVVAGAGAIGYKIYKAR